MQQPKIVFLGQALTTRAKRVGEFNDKKNVPKPDRESDSSIVARGKTPVWKRVKGRTSASSAESMGECHLQSAGNALFSATNSLQMHDSMR